jgi:hypothetical protein
VIRLTIVVEGQTEEAFVKQVLRPHLDARDVFATPVVIESSRTPAGKKWKGGGMHWPRLGKELKAHLRDRGPDLRVSTLFDLYGLPSDFPGLASHRDVADTTRRVELLEQALAAELADPRFVPYLQRHEFEALVLASLDQLAAHLDPAPRRGIRALRDELAGCAPEDVNDGPTTAPSKRLAQHVVGYNKVVHGPDAIRAAGLEALRGACPRFGTWLTRLESLAGDR